MRCEGCGNELKNELQTHMEGDLTVCNSCGLDVITGKRPEERGIDPYKEWSNIHLRKFSPTFRIKLKRLKQSKDYITGEVLDIGSGDCLIADWIHNNLDYKSMVRIDKNPIRRGVVKMDAEKLRFPDNSFDTVLAIDVAEHIKNDKKFIREVRRVLKPNGYLIFSVPFQPECFCIFDRRVGHYRRYTWETFFNLLNEGGFTPIDLQLPSLLARIWIFLNPKFHNKTFKTTGVYAVCKVK